MPYKPLYWCTLATFLIIFLFLVGGTISVLTNTAQNPSNNTNKVKLHIMCHHNACIYHFLPFPPLLFHHFVSQTLSYSMLGILSHHIRCIYRSLCGYMSISISILALTTPCYILLIWNGITIVIPTHSTYSQGISLFLLWNLFRLTRS